MRTILARLFVNLQLNSKIHQENMADFIIPPYDLYCQSMLSNHSKHCCSVFGIYHASIKSVLSHTKACHPKTAPPAVITKIQLVEKRRPMRIAARRQQVMMAILRDHLKRRDSRVARCWWRWDGPRQSPATAVSNKCYCAYNRQHPGVDGYPM